MCIVVRWDEVVRSVDGANKMASWRMKDHWIYTDT